MTDPLIPQSAPSAPTVAETLRTVHMNLCALLDQSDLLTDSILPSMWPTSLNEADRECLSDAINAIRALIAKGLV